MDLKKNPFSQAQTSKSDSGGRAKWQAFQGAVQRAARLKCVGIRYLPHFIQGHRPRPKGQLRAHHSLILTLGPGISTPRAVPTTLPPFSKRATEILWPHGFCLPPHSPRVLRVTADQDEDRAVTRKPFRMARPQSPPALGQLLWMEGSCSCPGDGGSGSVGIAFSSRALYPPFTVYCVVLFSYFLLSRQCMQMNTFGHSVHLQVPEAYSDFPADEL